MSRFHLLFCLILVLAGCATAPAGDPSSASQSDASVAGTDSAGPAFDTAAPTYDGRPLIIPATGEEVTLEKWLAYWGIDRDPGADPDPKRTWLRDPPGFRYQIQKFEKKWAAFDQPDGLVRPLKNFNVAREIYQMNDEYVWAWMLAPGEVLPAQIAALDKTDESKYRVFTEDQLEYLREFKKDFTMVEPRRARRTVRFVESSEGLPQGSWRNSPAIVDMNGDGNLDIVAPPQRGSINAVPAIYLGDGRGGWSYWREASFGGDHPLDYGSISAGDLNGDGAIDLVMAIHLDGVVAFLGDGAGRFEQVTRGLEMHFPTRRARLEDMDLDGDLDIVAITEGPVGIRDVGGRRLPDPPSRIMLFLNDGSGTAWTAQPLTEQWRQMGGDWLEVGRFNEDPYPDVAASSIYFSGPDVLYLGGEEGWTGIGRKVMPLFSYYMGLTSGHFTSPHKKDVMMTFGHFWPGDLEPEVLAPPEERQVVGIYRVSFDGERATRTPVARWGGQYGVSSIAAGDLDGDGHEDLVYAMAEPREARILLGDGKGGFRAAEVEGLPLPPHASYDISLGDVDNDGRLDIVMLFEKEEYTAGAIRVWLNRTE